MIAAFVYSPEFSGYDLGSQHPLKPVRLRMTYELLNSYGMFGNPDGTLVTPIPATEDQILRAHDAEYVDAVRQISSGMSVQNPERFGFGYGDNPPFNGMYEASMLYTGASITAAELVASGEASIAFNISGGLHHALRNRASGFCVFNDPVAAINKLLSKFSHITYIDIDAHHGDGVQYAFQNRSDVLTISIHESGQWLFPGTGFAKDIGTGEGRGYSVNLPVAPFTDDETWLQVFSEIIPPLVQAFSPDVIVAQLGADGHFDDPLTHLSLTTQGWLKAVRTILDFGKPVIALGGGGYDLSAVTRMWTLAYAAMLQVDLPDKVPGEFLNKYGIRRLLDAVPPVVTQSQKRMAREVADETIRTVRELVFPIHGII